MLFVVALAANEDCHGVPALCDHAYADRLPRRAEDLRIDYRRSMDCAGSPAKRLLQ